MYNQPNPQLPFDPIALGILPAFVPYVPMTMALLKREIETKRAQNAARENIFASCYQQTDYNPAFHKHLVTVSEFAMMLIDMHRMPPEQAIQTAVVEALTMSVANWLNSNRQYISSQEMMDGVMATARDALAVSDQIQQYLNRVRMQQPQQQWSPHQQHTPQNWQTHQTTTHYNPGYNSGFQQPQQFNSFGNNGFMNGGSMTGGHSAPAYRHDRSDFTSVVSPVAANMTTEFKPVEVSHFTNAATEPVAPQRQVKAVRRITVRGSVEEISAAPVTPKRVLHVEPVVNAPSEQWRTTPTTTSSTDWTQQFDEVSSKLEIAADSTLKRSFTSDAPYAVVYDPEVNFLMFENINGVVLERLGKVDKGDELEYLDHEMDTDNIRKIADDQRLANKAKVVSVLEGITVRKLGNKSELPTTEETADLEGLDAPYTIEVDIPARDLDEAIDNSITALLAQEIPTPDTYEFDYVNLVPLPITSEPLLEGLVILGGSKTINDVIDSLVALEPLLPGQWYSNLVTRLTGMVNDAVVHRMGIRVEIDSVVEDYNDLLATLQSKYGDAIVDVFLENEHDIVQSFVGGIRFEKRKPTSEFDDTARFGWREYVLTIPFSYAALSVACNEKSGAIIETNTPELYNALKAILVDSDVQPPIWVRNIVTCDGFVFRVHQGYFNPDYIVLEFHRKP